MSLWQSFKDSAVQNRIEDEAYYTEAANEISQGIKRDGLWAKAIALSEGNEEQVKAKYILLLVNSLKDEAYIAQQQLQIITPTPLESFTKEINNPRPLWRRVLRKILNGFITFGLWLWIGIMLFGGIMWVIEKLK